MFNIFMDEITEFFNPHRILTNLREGDDLKVCRQRIVDSVCLINSRVSRSMGTGHPWTTATKILLEGARQDFGILISGIGMLHYDFPLFCWLHYKGKAVVVFESLRQKKSICNDPAYRWFTENPSVRFITITHGKRSIPGVDNRLFRDMTVLALASAAIEGRIRAGGNMQGLIAEFRSGGGQVYLPKLMAESPTVDVSGNPIGCGGEVQYFDMLDPPPDGEFLFHFTRDRQTPWPGEGWEHYLADMAGWRQTAPYRAIDSLFRIVAERRIYASRNLIRGKHPVVCFTELTPERLDSLCHWQNHLRRSRFTRYGIGFRKAALIKAGACPVTYGRVDLYAKLDLEKQYLFQHQGKDHWKQDWSLEKEWRISGDLDFGSISSRDWSILVPDSDT